MSMEIIALDTLLAGPNPSISDRLKRKRLLKKRDESRKRLKRLRAVAKSQKKFRKTIKRKLVEHKTRPASGRPALEESGLENLPSVILKIASHVSAADPRRRSEILSLPKTLDDLKKKLEKEGITVKRSTLYKR